MKKIIATSDAPKAVGPLFPGGQGPIPFSLCPEAYPSTRRAVRSWERPPRSRRFQVMENLKAVITARRPGNGQCREVFMLPERHERFLRPLTKYTAGIFRPIPRHGNVCRSRDSPKDVLVEVSAICGLCRLMEGSMEDCYG